MVKRTIRAITNKISGLHEAAFWLASFSIFSQILAFLRDRLLAGHFGAGRALDLYYASFEVPDLLFNTVASLISASILIPLLAKWYEEGEKDNRNNVDSIFTSFSILLIVSCGLALLFMPKIVPLFFINLGEDGVSQVIQLSRILLLSPLFLGLSNFFGSIVQYEKRFVLYSISPLFYNFGIILGVVFGATRLGIFGVVLGVASGAFMHMTLQALWVFLSKNGPRIIKNINFSLVRKTFFLSVPRTMSLSATSLVGLFFVALASRFEVGSIAVFTFSFNLQSVPLVIIGSSYSLAAFPTLSSYYV